MKALVTALRSKLTGDATLMALVTGVYRNVAPDDATYPCVVLQKLDGSDDYTLGRRVSTAYTYQARVDVEGGDLDAADDALARIDALLTDQTLTVSGSTVWVVRRIGDISDYAESQEGRIYQHVGATYSIVLA